MCRWNTDGITVAYHSKEVYQYMPLSSNWHTFVYLSISALLKRCSLSHWDFITELRYAQCADVRKQWLAELFFCLDSKFPFYNYVNADVNNAALSGIKYCACSGCMNSKILLDFNELQTQESDKLNEEPVESYFFWLGFWSVNSPARYPWRGYYCCSVKVAKAQQKMRGGGAFILSSWFCFHFSVDSQFVCTVL